jgi:hypothetical protein
MPRPAKHEELGPRHSIVDGLPNLNGVTHVPVGLQQQRGDVDLTQHVTLVLEAGTLPVHLRLRAKPDVIPAFPHHDHHTTIQTCRRGPAPAPQPMDPPSQLNPAGAARTERWKRRRL